MTEFQQGIAYALLFWCILTIANFVAIRGFEKHYKTKYHLQNVYKLGKIKMLLCFYERKSGEIAKFAFWLNIVSYIFAIAFVVALVLYTTLQVQPWGRLVLTFLVSQLVLACVSSGFDSYYMSKHKKQKKMAIGAGKPDKTVDNKK